MVAAVRFPELIIICVTISSLAQAVMYNVTMYIAETPNAASMAEVIISLIGTEGESERKSLGSVSTTTSAYVSTSNLGYIKTLVTEKKQTGTMNDDNLQFVKVTVTSDANAQKFEFVCPLPYCNIRFPNLVVKLHTGVDGQWSQWSNWRCECEAENNRRTRDRKCDNPAPYFTGAVCVGSNVDTIINGCFSECKPLITITPKPIIPITSPTEATEKSHMNVTSHQHRTSNVLIIGAVLVARVLSLQS